jgi:hypothetical protein
MDFQANEKENKQKGRVMRETFPEFMRRNPHFFSVQEDRPNQPYPPCRPGYRRVMDMRTGLTFEIEKAKLPLMEKEEVALNCPTGWNPSLVETRGDYHSRRYMESLHVSPPALESENKKILDFSPVPSWAKCHEVHNIPHQPARQRTALELRLMGLAPEPKGPPRGPGSTNPTGTSSSAASSSTSPSSSSSGLALYLSHASGPERLSSRPPSYTSPPHQLPPPSSKMVDQNP